MLFSSPIWSTLLLVAAILAVIVELSSSENEHIYDDGDSVENILLDDESCKSPFYSKVHINIMHTSVGQLRSRIDFEEKNTELQYILLYRLSADAKLWEKKKWLKSQDLLVEGDLAQLDKSWCLSRMAEYQLIVSPKKSSVSSTFSDIQGISICGEHVAELEKPFYIDNKIMSECYKYSNNFINRKVDYVERQQQQKFGSTGQFGTAASRVMNSMSPLLASDNADTDTDVSPATRSKHILEEDIPTSTPTSIPTAFPTSAPSPPPTSTPTSIPTAFPTSAPSPPPTSTPTAIPTSFPTSFPTIMPTSNPTFACLPTTPPSAMPSPAPTSQPSVPSSMPTSQPSVPSSMPSSAPSTPTFIPTFAPTPVPSERPIGGDGTVGNLNITSGSSAQASSTEAFVDTDSGIGTLVAAGVVAMGIIAGIMFYFYRARQLLVKAPLAPQELAMQI